MIFKRVKSASNTIHVAVHHDNVWKLIDTEYNLMDCLTSDFNPENFDLHTFESEAYEDLIPFKPTAYRDFMLYEQHVIDASRGFVKKYLPKLLPIVKTYETLLSKPFPKLKPKKRFYQYPIYYLGNHLNFISDGDSISIPSYTSALDYELEIAAVIGKPLKNASTDDVEDAIAGFVILNDFSARDVQMSEMASGFGPMKSKNFGSAISCQIASKDDLIHRLEDLKASVTINDQIIKETTTKGMYYSFQKAIAYASWEEQLHPGELFGSGTIPGCSGIENGVMLNSGDTITLAIEGIGQLTNKIV